MAKIVLADGCFDILHLGHLLYLEEARRHGDLLVVGVTANAFVNKGPGKPLYDQLDRLRLVRSLRCVEHAFLAIDSLCSLKTVRPQVFAKGKEYEGNLVPEHEAYCRENGIEIRFTDTEYVRPLARLARS